MRSHYKRLNEEGVSVEAGLAAAANKAEFPVNYFLRGVVSRKRSARENTFLIRGLLLTNSSLVVYTLCSLGGKLQDLLTGQSVLGNGSFDVTRVSSSHDVFQLSWIELVLNGNLLPCRRLMNLKPRPRLVLERV